MNNSWIKPSKPIKKRKNDKKATKKLQNILQLRKISIPLHSLLRSMALLNKINEIVKIHDNEKNGGNQ